MRIGIHGMTSPSQNPAGESRVSEVTRDDYKQAIDQAGYKVTDDMIEAVCALHRKALNRALIARAFAQLRAAERNSDANP